MLFKKYRSGLLIIVSIAFGVYCFVLGDNGVLERLKLIKSKQQISQNIANLQSENEALQNEYSIISKNDTNTEVYKNEASGSGYIDPDEKYIFFKNEKKEEVFKPVKQEAENYPVKLSHLRILWGVASIMIILLYLARKKRAVENAEFRQFE